MSRRPVKPDDLNTVSQGFKIGPVRLLTKLWKGTYRLFQRQPDGTERALGDAQSIQGIDVSTTAPTTTQILHYNANTGQWEPTAAGSAAAHAAQHENGGADEISVTGLSGLLADDQHVLDAEVVAAIATADPYLVNDANDTTTGDLTVANLITAGNVDGRDVSADGTKLDGIAAGADVTGDNAPQAHHDSHDPEDGTDALDCAAAAEISVVVAAGEGSAHEFARADHVHAITHAITDNHIVTIDGTANQNEHAVFGAGGIAGLTDTELLAALSGDAGAAFDWNSQNLTSIGTIGSGAITSTAEVTGTTLEATGDTSAGDNSALGYTAAEGAIITGQGTTSDVTIKNDADGEVISVPTGTTITKLASEIWLTERADHESAPAAGYGYLWCKNTAPSTLVFTDDAGTDTTLGAGGGGGDITTDDAWEAAGDLIVGTGDDTADILSLGAAHSVLWTDGAAVSWKTAPELQYIADTGGTTRITTSTAPPHVLISTTFNVAGVQDVAATYTQSTRPSCSGMTNNYDCFAFAPIPFTANGTAKTVALCKATSQLTINDGKDVSYKGFVIDTGITASDPGAGDCNGYWGLYIRNKLLDYDGSDVPTYGIQFDAPFNYLVSSGIPNPLYGFRMEDHSAIYGDVGIDYECLSIEDQASEDTGAVRLMEIGPATPYLRVIGSNQPAGENSNVIVNFGGTLYYLTRDGTGAVGTSAV